MRFFYTILFSLLLGNILTICAQSSSEKIDIIEQNLKSSKDFMQKNLDSSFFYANRAQLLSQKIDNDTLLAKANIQKSSVLIFKKGFNEADSLLQGNLTKRLPLHIEGQTLHNLGTIQYYKQDFEKALDIYLQAAKTMEKVNNSKLLVNTYTNIGTINSILKNFKNATTYLERALPLSEFNEILRLQILVNLSNIYKEQKLYKKFSSTILEAEQLAEKYKSKRSLSAIYNNLSTHYSEDALNNPELDYDLSITYGKKSVAIKKELNLIHSLGLPYNNIGHSYLRKGQYQTAIKYLDSALPKSQGLLKSYVYNNLKESYEGINNFKKAIIYADLKDQLKDSINNAQQKEKVAELTEKFESEKKQQQIDILDTKTELQALTISQQKYLLIVLIAFGLLFLILGYFGFQNYKTKQQLNTVLLQQKLRKTQLNPHFLFNALQSIQNFIYKNDKEKSSSYLSSYSKLIRLVLEKSDDNFTSVADDQLAIESYLKLQQLNQNDSFSYTVTVENTVDEDFDTLPTLITQPFVENAVLHGLKNVTNGNIAVSYYKENAILFVSIKDNGKGFEVKSEESKKLHKSMSMTIIKEQLENLNRTSKGFNGDISIHPSQSGTKVTLSFASK
ncbi:hypothetical protein AWE51_03730 [Aquimarina aggregata]|uniref:Signal transduction histidine kinase internal region domain-containing protein n=2 Tax=Aquimarina aggregata TaxID=1642818 RepID=A0A162CUY9_9FLAO|nr:hypothetical protein AWE51_03730 [Aquimarina aggregata]